MGGSAFSKLIICLITHLSGMFEPHLKTGRRPRQGECCEAQSGITHHSRQSTLQTKFGFVTIKFEVAQFLISSSHENVVAQLTATTASFVAHLPCTQPGQ
jgi:hypothetical protein